VLEKLGERYHHPGTVYLVGGASLILLDAKTSSLDIDLKIEVSREDYGEFVRCLRGISLEMEIAIEEASPGDFIPLPGGYENRRKFVGRFGALDVFHFDPYSIALSKIHRGSEKDAADVVGMLEKGLIMFNELERAKDEILPALADFGLNTNPDDFARKFEIVRTRWAARG